jgi:heat-inducible transcriptional repressor
MPPIEELSEREQRVLAAIVQSYIETAEPAGSQTVARRSGLGISPASIRATMSELEAKGYLFHKHTSAGRIPTDLAYRIYVDTLMRRSPPSRAARETLHAELAGRRSAIDLVLRRAAQVLSVLTMELGVAVGPVLDEVVLERLELLPVASDRLLLVLSLRSGVARTIFVEVTGALAPEVIQQVAGLLNERLAGLSLRVIRATLAERLRDADGTGQGSELLNIFIAQGEELFQLEGPAEEVLLGSATVLAGQPEFASSNDRMRELLELTEQRERLGKALADRRTDGLSITIGSENPDPRLAGFTLVTSTYRSGDLRGVIGVLGPTRMPYDKIIGLVDHTSRLVEGLMK